MRRLLQFGTLMLILAAFVTPLMEFNLVIVGHRMISRVRRWFEGESTAEGLVGGAKTAMLVIPEADGTR